MVIAAQNKSRINGIFQKNKNNVLCWMEACWGGLGQPVNQYRYLALSLSNWKCTTHTYFYLKSVLVQLVKARVYCPIVELFLLKDNSVKSFNKKHYAKHKSLVLSVVFFCEGIWLSCLEIKIAQLLDISTSMHIFGDVVQYGTKTLYNCTVVEQK